MERKNCILFFILLCISAQAQLKSALGVNVNAGYIKRLSASLCFETQLKNNIFFRVHAGYGSFLPFNSTENTGRLFLMRRITEPQNNSKHINLIYSGYRLVKQESTVVAPEIKAGVIYVLPKFRQKNRLLSGLYFGALTSMAKITQPYTNHYRNDSLLREEVITGVNKYYSWSWISLLAGFKKMIGNKTTVDIGLEQSLGILYDSRFKKISDYYKNPYSGLKVDLSIGIRRLF